MRETVNYSFYGIVHLFHLRFNTNLNMLWSRIREKTKCSVRASNIRILNLILIHFEMDFHDALLNLRFMRSNNSSSHSMCIVYKHSSFRIRVCHALIDSVRFSSINAYNELIFQRKFNYRNCIWEFKKTKEEKIQQQQQRRQQKSLWALGSNILDVNISCFDMRF